MKYFSSNVLFLREDRGLKQSQMIDLVGVEASTWSNYEKGKSFPNLKLFNKIAKYFEVSETDLLNTDLQNVQVTEKGWVKKESENVQGNVQEHVQVNTNYRQKEASDLFVANEPVIEYKAVNKMPAVISINHTGQENIVYVPIKARAGYLNGYGDPEFMEKLPQIFDPIYRNGTYRLWEVDGSSMFPTLHDKDKALCRWDSISNAVDGRVYVIVTKNDGILIKRIINRHKEGKFICKSDNNYRGEYPPIILDVQHITEVWYVVEARSKQLSEPGEIYKRTVNLEADMILMKQEMEKMKQTLLKP